MSLDYGLIVEVLLVICFLLHFFCSKRYILAKIAKNLQKTDIKTSFEAILDSESTRQFIFDVIYNLAGHATHIIDVKPYADDIFKTAKNHIFAACGRDGRIKKSATKEIVKQMVNSHPIGQYASMLFGDQIEDYISENPEKALEKVKILLNFAKGMDGQQLQAAAQMYAKQQ